MFDAAMDAGQAQGTLPGTVEPAAPVAVAPAAPVPQAAAPAQPVAAPASPVYQQQPLRQVGEAPAPRPVAPAAPASAFRPAAAHQEAPVAAPRPRTEMKPAASPAASAFSAPGVEKSIKPNRRVLTVGNDILLKGEIATCDRLVIEGRVDATLNDVHTVEIAETGSFRGVAHVEEAEISGVFEGELMVKSRLVIYATGRVRGKITYGEIEIERGGELTGEIKTPSSIATTTPASSRRTAAVKEDKVAA